VGQVADGGPCGYNPKPQPAAQGPTRIHTLPLFTLQLSEVYHRFHTTQIYTHVLRNQKKKRKKEAMSREHAIMCRNKQEIVQKGKNEANMPL
jgi:hypothetical protein